MSNTKHTPGPWHIDVEPNTVSKYRVVGPTGENVGWFDPDAETELQGEANAKLIAAAPFMLDKHDEIYNDVKLTGDESREDLINMLEIVRSKSLAAIKKATE